MFGYILNAICALFFYVASFYARVQHFMMMPGLVGADFNPEFAVEAGSIVADATGQKDIANSLRIVLDNMKEHDNLKSISAVLEIILSPKMTYEQYKAVKFVDEKFDAILDFGNSMSKDATNAIKQQLSNLMQGVLTVDQLDGILHAVIKGYEENH